MQVEMDRLVSPNVWSCMPTALAMLVRKPIKNILDIIGHDGSIKQWPQLEDPYCRRSFCINEIIFAALECGFGLVELSQSVDYHPMGEDEGSIRVDVPHRRWEIDMLKRFDALLLGTGESGVSHAVAWNHERKLIHDPNGCRYNLELFRRDLIYGLVPIGTTNR
jgi:hypothetical protein